MKTKKAAIKVLNEILALPQEELIKKFDEYCEEDDKKILEEDKKHWAYEVQTGPLPSWTAAFEYAYQLGLKRGKDEQEKI